ncbi:MAG: NACHT domain-containing protein [bacterium]|nr:NACHT domain-containing protein [bacterium]
MSQKTMEPQALEQELAKLKQKYRDIDPSLPETKTIRQQIETLEREIRANSSQLEDRHPELKTYFTAMRKLYGQMQLWRMTSPMTLDGIFTHVNVLCERSAFRHPSQHEVLENMYLGKTDSGAFGEIIDTRKDGLDAIKENQRLFIFGKPGAGKTTFLKYLTLQAIESVLSYVPIFVPLKQFSDTGQNLWEFILQQFERCNFPDAEALIQTALQEGKALVLCDGLDEVNKEGAHRTRIIQELNDFSQKYDNSKFIITCRVAAAEYFFKGFRYVEMADFDDEQVRCFVTNWFTASENPFLTKDAAENFLEECTERSERLLDLAKSPLLLTLLCIAYEETLTFSDKRSEIYEEALDALLKKWDSSRGILRGNMYHKLSLNRKRQMFSRIAAETFERGEYLFKQSELERKIVAFLKTLPPADQDEEIDGEPIIKAIEAQHGIFVERAQKLYSFSHLTFQEYFTAKYILAHQQHGALKALIFRHCTDEDWREVFLLTAEMLDDADQFFEFFLTKLDKMVESDERLSRFLKQASQIAENSQITISALKRRTAAIFYQLRITLAFNFIDSISSLIMTFDSSFGFTFASPFLFSDAGIYPAAGIELSEVRPDDLNRELFLDLILVRLFSLYPGIQTIEELPEWPYESERVKQAFTSAILLSQEFGLNELHEALAALVLPDKTITFVTWKKVSETIREIFQTHRPVEDYTFSKEQANHLTDYLQATTLLVKCLKVAAVSDRQTIENRLFCPPKSGDNKT